MKLKKSVPVGKLRPEMELRRVGRRQVQAVSKPPASRSEESSCCPHVF